MAGALVCYQILILCLYLDYSEVPAADWFNCHPGFEGVTKKMCRCLITHRIGHGKCRNIAISSFMQRVAQAVENKMASLIEMTKEALGILVCPGIAFVSRRRAGVTR